MGDGNYFDATRGFSKNNQIWESLEQHLASTECILGELSGVAANTVNGVLYLNQEPLSSPDTAPQRLGKSSVMERSNQEPLSSPDTAPGVPSSRSFSFFRVRPGGFEPMRCSPFQTRPEAPARFFPRNQINSTVVNLVKATMGLLAPGCVSRSLFTLIQTTDQGIDQRPTEFGWQSQSIS